MLLKKRYGRPLSALSLSLAMAFAPLFNVQAAEPEVVPGDSSATPGELSVALSQSDGQSPAVAKLAGEQPLSMEAAANSRAQIEALLPAGYKPVFMNPLVSLYAARDMKPMWENREAVQAFQQQLAEIAIAGFQPQFTTWVSLLTDPAVSGMARDVVLSDAMMGYLHFISGIPTQGTRWLYSSTPYKMATPPLSVINQWQLALDNGSLPAFIAGLAPRHPQYEAMHQSLLALVADSRPWPQMTGSGSLRPGEWSNDIGAARWRAGAEHSASTSAARQTIDRYHGEYSRVFAGLLPGRQSGAGLAGDRRTSRPQDADDEQRAEQRSGQSAVERTAHPGAQRYSAEGA